MSGGMPVADGILIPKIDAFPTTNPTVDQNGMMVFLTQDVGVNAKGFYYWDFATLTWKNISESATNWKLTGNTVSAIDFIGTTNNQDIRFKRQNMDAGNIGLTTVSIGVNSLNDLSTGINNNAIGSLTLASNTTGGGNNAFGFSGLSANTTGFQNNAFGGSSLRANTTGISNNAFGDFSLRLNTIGNDNSAFGQSSLLANSDGDKNSAFGFEALRSNTTGNKNSSFGNKSLYTNISGIDNSGFGSDALYNSTGSNNVAFGTAALSNLTAGNNNIGFGFNAQVPIATGSNQLSIANKIYGLDLNTSTPKFGINTASPTSLWHLSKSIAADGGNDFMLFDNSAVGGAGFQFKNVNAATNLWQAFLSSAGDFKIGRAGIADWMTFKTVNTTSASVQLFNGLANGNYSLALGRGSIASGDYSNTFGVLTSARSLGETVIGLTNVDYTPAGTTTYSATDRLFVIGNGSANISPSNALNMLKNGNTRFGNGDPTAKVDVEGEIKISSSSTAANIVGAGGLRWDGTYVQFSDGTNWSNISNNNSSWSLTGNAASGTDFIGTTNNEDIRFRRNGINAGVIKANSTALGLNSLNPLSTGISNTAIGADNLSANTSGGQNTSVGKGALRFNTMGSQNAAMGNLALFTNVLGFRNTAFGFGALYNATGTENTAFGNEALDFLTTGNNNIGIGNDAQVTNLTGSNQLSIGNSIYGSNLGANTIKIGIGVPSPNGTLQFINENVARRIVFWEDANNDHQYTGFGKLLNAIDYHIGTTTNNHIFSAGTSATTSSELMRIQGDGNVGIGSIAPTSKLEIRQDAATSINSNVFRLTNFVTNGDNLGSSIVFGSGGTTATNQHWAKIDGFHSGAGNTNIAFSTSTGANYEAATEKMRVTGVGNVGIGNNNPETKLTVNGGLTITNTATFTANVDNFTVTVGNNSYIFVVSDNASAANRTLVLSNGLAVGQMLFLQANSTATNFFSLTEGVSNVDFVGGAGANFDFNGADIIQLLWNGNDWILINYQNIT